MSNDSQLMQLLQLLFNPYGRRRQRPDNGAAGIRLAQLHTETELRALFRSPAAPGQGERSPRPQRTSSATSTSRQQSFSLDGLPGSSKASTAASLKATPPATPSATPPATPLTTPQPTPKAADTPAPESEAHITAPEAVAAEAVAAEAVAAEAVPTQPKDLQALASLCLALLNWKLSSNKAFQQHALDFSASVDPIQQLLDISSTGAVVCQLINALVPGTLDERAVHQVTVQHSISPTHSSEGSLQQLEDVQLCQPMAGPGVTSEPIQVPKLELQVPQDTTNLPPNTLQGRKLSGFHEFVARLESDWFLHRERSAGDLLQTQSLPVGLSHCKALQPDIPAGQHFDELQADASSEELEGCANGHASAAAAAADTVILPVFDKSAQQRQPAQQVAQHAGQEQDSTAHMTQPASGQHAKQRSPRQVPPETYTRLLLCNWQLAVGSAQAVGCSLQGITAPQLAQGEVEPIVGCVLQLIAAHYLKDTCLERSPKLQQFQQPGESDADLLCVPAHQWVDRWVQHCRQQAAVLSSKDSASPDHASPPDSQASSHPSAKLQDMRSKLNSRIAADAASSANRNSTSASKPVLQVEVPSADSTANSQQGQDKEQGVQGHVGSTDQQKVTEAKDALQRRQRRLGGQWMAQGLQVSLDELHDILAACASSLPQTGTGVQEEGQQESHREADRSSSKRTEVDAAETGVVQGTSDPSSGPTLDMNSPFASVAFSSTLTAQVPHSNTVSSEQLKLAQDTVQLARQLTGACNSLPSFQPDWLVHGGEVARALLLLLVMHGQYCTTPSSTSSPTQHTLDSDINSPTGQRPTRRQQSLRGRNRRISEDWTSSSGRSSASGEGVGTSRTRRSSVGAEAGTQADSSEGPLEGVLSEQEEKLLLAWLNALLSERSYRVSGLFCAAMRTGYPLLLACDVMSPGVVSWSRAFTPPYSKQRVPRKLMAVENGNQVCRICKNWNLHVVNIGGIDIAEGHQSAIMSLVWQLMRHHMVMLLHALQGPPGSPPSPWSNPASPRLLTSSMSLGRHYASSSANGALPSPRSAEPVFHTSPRTFSRNVTGIGSGAVSQAQRAFLPPTLPRRGTGSSAGSDVAIQHQAEVKAASNAGSNSTARLPRQQQMEEEVLRWANAKLQSRGGQGLDAAPASADSSQGGGAGTAVQQETIERVPSFARNIALRITGLQDPCLSTGKVLLALMDSMCPGAVNPAYVLAGELPFEKEQNARYVLSVARSLGCQHVHMLWEDIVTVRPRPILMLLASLMAQDKHGSGNQQQA